MLLPMKKAESDPQKVTHSTLQRHSGCQFCVADLCIEIHAHDISDYLHYMKK